MLRRLLLDDEMPAHESAQSVVAARRAVIMGCDGELREQLLLMMDLMGWSVDAVDTAAGLLDVLSVPQSNVWSALPGEARSDPQADLGPDLLFIEAGQIAKAGFAINRSRTVVFLGRAPAHGRALFAGKTIIWLDTPLDIVKLERVIVNAA